MGIGFTIDTPLRVCRYGIASVISLVDDVLIEQVRRDLCARLGERYDPIEDGEDDARARRIARYLDLVQREALRSFERLRASSFEEPEGIRRYLALLPDEAPLKALYRRYAELEPGPERDALEREIRAGLRPGSIDVNIMTKLDRALDDRGRPRPAGQSDAVAALRGFALSELEGAVVLSAGLNPKVTAAIGEFDAFFPVGGRPPRKRVILKVSDLRSAQVQGRMLARRGIWVSEYRIESGLNCGGHAFPSDGVLLGPILETFQQNRASIAEDLFAAYAKAVTARGLPAPDAVPPIRVTVQGGIGTAEEDRLMREHYGADGTGWASPFLMVPEVANVSEPTLRALEQASLDDVRLTWGSPLGVPFWSLRTSECEVRHRERIDEGRPGSSCPKGYIALYQEYGDAPLCKASRGYQRRKLAEIDAEQSEHAELLRARVIAPTCICHDLGGDVKRLRGIETDVNACICPGPNVRWFQRRLTLDEMVDHIYGRRNVITRPGRPHQLVTEAELYVEYLERELALVGTPLGQRPPRYFAEYAANLLDGLERTLGLAPKVPAAERAAFVEALEALRGRVNALALPQEPAGSRSPRRAPVAAE